MTPLVTVKLAAGRAVALSRLHLVPSVTDWSSVNKPKRMVDQIPELVERYIGVGIPWILKNPLYDHLPTTCIALFESEPMVSHGVTIENSLLVICWFTQSVDLPLRNVACEGLSEVEWEKHAKDFHSDW